jgi:hypothetical protein
MRVAKNIIDENSLDIIVAKNLCISTTSKFEACFSIGRITNVRLQESVER